MRKPPRTIDLVVHSTPGAFMFPEDVKGPRYTPHEATKMFFPPRQASWLRWQERLGNLVIDGVEVKPSRDPDTDFRFYTLADVERITHALLLAEVIKPDKAYHALLVAKIQGKMWGVLDED